MAKLKRKTIYLAPPVEAALRRIANQRHMSANEVIRMAISWADVIEQARERGHYLGTATDPTSLNTIIISPL